MADVIGTLTGDWTQEAQRRFRPVVVELGGLLAVGADDAGADVAVFF
jgi:hypothetical protein